MIERIDKSKIFTKTSKKIIQKRSFQTLPIVKTPLILKMPMVQLPEQNQGGFWDNWFREREQNKIEKLINEKIQQQEQERALQQRIKAARKKEEEIKKQKQIEAEKLRLAEIAKQKELERIQELEKLEEIEVQLAEDEEIESTRSLFNKTHEFISSSIEDLRFLGDITRHRIIPAVLQKMGIVYANTKEYLAEKMHTAKVIFQNKIKPRVINTSKIIYSKTKDYAAEKLEIAKSNFKYKIMPKALEVTNFVLVKTNSFIESAIERTQAMQDLKSKQKLFLTKFNKYQEMASDYAHLEPFKDWKKADIDELASLDKTLNGEINRAKMINKLKKEFRKGADFYMPDGWKNNFEPDELFDIEPKKIEQGNSKAYHRELKQICNIFEQNSKIVEPAISIFNEIVTNFFKESSKSIKEIFNLQNNKEYKWLERIPKLGIIPKILRIKEQRALTKCIMQDYKDLSKKQVQQTIIPYFQKYNAGYDKIKAFIDNNIEYLSDEDKEFSEKILKKMKTIKERRDNSNSNIINSYTKGGMNINNICISVRKKGAVELITKTLSTFVTFF